MNIDTLRRIHALAMQRGPLHEVDEDLQREAGMDGNYQQLLQAARDLDAAARQPPPTVVWDWLPTHDFPGSRVTYATIGDIAIDVRLPGDVDSPAGAVILRLLSREGDPGEPKVVLEDFPADVTVEELRRVGLDNLDALCRMAGIVNPLG